MLAQQQSVLGIENAHVKLIPLHIHFPSDPAWRQARSKRHRLRRNRPDSRPACHAGSSEKVPGEAAARLVFLRQTWCRLTMWEEEERTISRIQHELEGRSEQEHRFCLHHDHWPEKADADEMIRPAENAGKGNE
jgi:hypothetical protein